MIGTINRAEHNLFVEPPNPITLSAATAAEVLPNERGVGTGEIAYRYIQNVGNNTLYYTFGGDSAPATLVNATTLFHGMLPAGAQLDCSNHRSRVCCYSTAGTQVAVTVVRRIP